MKLKRIIESEEDKWDKAWEQKFGPTDQVKIMSAEDTLKELEEMANFKYDGEPNDSNKNKSI